MNTEKIFKFGEKVKGFDVLVLNEREARAGAGILFFLAITSFLNAWLVGDFYLTKIFDVIFLIDFSIRVFVNPKFSPSLILGRFIVSNQEPEYVGASQKRFAWFLGLCLAVIMFFVLIVNNIIGPINLIICLICLLLLLFETAFGICLGCKMYNFFKGTKATLCPGGVCEPRKKEAIQQTNIQQWLIVILFALSIYYVANSSIIKNNNKTQIIPNQNIENASNIKNETNKDLINPTTDDCKVPNWAIEIGHEEKWKLHHNCK